MPHHSQHLCLAWRHTCFVQPTKTELYPWSQYISAWFGLVIALLMVFPKNVLMCILKVRLINHDCLPILMLLDIVLYIVLAYFMLFAAISNVVCLHKASFFCHWFQQMLLIFMLCLCLFHFFICIMHSAFNLFVFPNSM